MGFFSFSSKFKHRQFDYIPRYYDPEKERLKAQLAKYDAKNKSDSELMKERIKSGLHGRRGSVSPGYRTKQVRSSNKLFLLILVFLVLGTLWVLVETLPTIANYFK